MDIINYFNNLLIDEEEIVKELILIDNKVCNTNMTYDDLIKSINSIKLSENDMKKPIDVITDGEVSSVFYALLNYNVNINKIHIDSTFLAINKWLVQRFNEYFNINIILDDGFNYNYYSNDIVIVGDSLFTSELSKMFPGAKEVYM